MSFLTKSLLLLPFSLLSLVTAEQEIKADDHLNRFMTRPELIVPKFDIRKIDESRVTPGYWFVSSYTSLGGQGSDDRWEPCQNGPSIYDGNGELVWSGACLFDNRNVFDFKKIDFHGQDALSFLVPHDLANSRRGVGMIYDNSYTENHTVIIAKQSNEFNLHEFNIINDGKTALAMTVGHEFLDASDIGFPQGSRVMTETNGFMEIDIETNEIIFRWKAIDHIPLHESSYEWPKQLEHGAWDYIHMNAADKFENGDYLVSARYMNSVYRIDGQSGKIKWRLTGNGDKSKSDFRLDGFDFSRQHHARVLKEDQHLITVSFLNNAAGSLPNDHYFGHPSSPASEGLIVELDVKHMTAKALHTYERPDGGLTRRRGSVQTLDNENVFIGWGEFGYISEHTPDGDVVLEAQFASKRYATYRAYKFNFTGAPAEPPTLKASVVGAVQDHITMVAYVSWNGATEVASWNFYGKRGPGEKGELTLLGNVPRAGFETIFMAEGYPAFVIAEALDKSGKQLPNGRSNAMRVEAPDWIAAGFVDPALPIAGTANHPSFNVSLGYQDEDDYYDYDDSTYRFSFALDGIVLFVLVGAACCGCLVVLVYFIRRQRMQARYGAVVDEEEPEEYKDKREDGPDSRDEAKVSLLEEDR